LQSEPLFGTNEGYGDVSTVELPLLRDPNDKGQHRISVMDLNLPATESRQVDADHHEGDNA